MVADQLAKISGEIRGLGIATDLLAVLALPEVALFSCDLANFSVSLFALGVESPGIELHRLLKARNRLFEGVAPRQDFAEMKMVVGAI